MSRWLGAWLSVAASEENLLVSSIAILEIRQSCPIAP